MLQGPRKNRELKAKSFYRNTVAGQDLENESRKRRPRYNKSCFEITALKLPLLLQESKLCLCTYILLLTHQ